MNSWNSQVTTTALTYTVFGLPKVSYAGQPLTFTTRKALGLLIFLLVDGNLHPRESLISLLWPESESQRGRSVFRQTLKYLRRSLSENADSYLLIQGDLVGINPDAGVDGDLPALNAAWQRLGQTKSGDHVSPGESPSLLEALESALGLYSDDFLNGFSIADALDFEQWIGLQRLRWQQRIEIMFDTLLSLQINSGQMLNALDSVQRWLRHVPTSENAYRTLMKIQSVLGNHAAAIQAYDACRKMLSEELDVLPSPETEALILQIRKNTPAPVLFTQSSALTATIVTQNRSQLVAELPLVGRSEHYASLIRCYQALLKDGLQVVTLYGEAGSGKTLLASDFLAWASVQGADIFQSQAFESGRQFPYRPIVHALRTRLEAENAPEDLLPDLWLSELASLLPELYERYPDLTAPQEAAVRSGQPRLAEAVARLGISLAERAPLVLFIDDIQWADVASLDLLHYTIYRWRESGSKILLLLTRRVGRPDGILTSWLSDLERLNCWTRLDLARLSLQDTWQFVANLAQPGREQPNEPLSTFSEWLFTETNGHPKRMVETLKVLLETNLLSLHLDARSPLDIDFAKSLQDKNRFVTQARAHLHPHVPPGGATAARGPDPSDLDRLYEKARMDELPSTLPAVAPTRSIRHNLPAQLTAFLGREHELAGLAEMLHDPARRPVTVLGAGGMGKTRLALESAAAQIDHFANGVFLVALAPLASPDSILSAIAEAVRFQFYQGVEPRRQLLDYLREKQLLLLLDNFEHLLDGAGLISEILQTAPLVKVMVTSRERLNLDGETLFRLEGMDFPDRVTSEGALEYSTVKLFLQSVRRVEPDYVVSEDTLPYLAQICRQVEGMPLAILLASAWIEVLSLKEISEEIARSLDFLETRRRDIPARQRSLRAVFDPSWKMLAAVEQDVFKKLSVFRGGFTRDAAEKVAGATPRMLMTFISKSMLRRDPSSGRYEIHELIRQYSTDRLAETPQERDAAQDAHCAYFTQLMADQQALFYSPRSSDAVDTIAADYNNVRVAWEMAIMQERELAIQQIAPGLMEYFQRSGSLLEMKGLFERAARRLENDNPTGICLGIALTGLGGSYSGFEEWEVCYAIMQRATDILRHFDCPAETAYALEVLGVSESFKIRTGESQSLKQALEIYRALNNPAGMARVLAAQTITALADFDLETASRCTQQAYELAEPLQDDFLLSYILFTQAFVAIKCGQFNEAVALAEQGLKITDQSKHPLHRDKGLNQLGLALMLTNNYRRAEEAFREVCDIAEAAGKRGLLAIAKTNLSWLLYLQARYEEAHNIGVEALHLHQELKDHSRVIANDLTNLGYMSIGLGQLSKAENYYREALNQQQAADDWLLAEALGGLAILVGVSGQPERAVAVLSMLVTHPRTPLQSRGVLEPYLARLHTELPPERFAAAQESGKELDRETVLQEFLASPPIFGDG